MSQTHFFDTIAALATPPGVGAIAIVRLSGEQSLSIAKRFFQTPKGVPLGDFRPRYLHYGHFVDNDTLVDEVLVAFMPAPHSFTGEDVVEIQCHGGAVVASLILECVLRFCRLADPGEFTRRAFLNGRIDLTQAEGIHDLIMSRTPEAQRLASDVMQGKLRQRIEQFRVELLSIAAHIAATIDFPDEDIAPDDTTRLIEKISHIRGQIREMLDGAVLGGLLRTGAKVALIGKPNVGKSSLLNAFAKMERAIVTPVPGTTRDVVAHDISLQGIVLQLLDTAGIHSTADEVEQCGIDRSRSAISIADLVVVLFDRSRPCDEADHDVIKMLEGSKVLPVLNKTDLPPLFDASVLPAQWPAPLLLSLKTDHDLSALENGIIAHLGAGAGTSEPPLVSRVRQRESLLRCEESLCCAEQGMRDENGFEVVAMDINHALSALQELAGEIVHEDVLDLLFSDFCIGK